YRADFGHLYQASRVMHLMRACAAWSENHMRDSDVTGAAVQVRLEGHLFAELENWRRAQPKIIPPSWALRQLLERALADDRRSGEVVSRRAPITAIMKQSG